MKKPSRLAYAALLFAFLLPQLLPRSFGAPRTGAVSAVPSPVPDGLISETPAPAPTPGQGPPAPETVRLLVSGEVLTLPMQEYLVGVLAGEMPASFAEEALKAQAVAARTYAMYCMLGPKHAEADVCADPGHCQAWQDEETMRSKWG